MKKIIMLLVGVAALCAANMAIAAEPTQTRVIAVKGAAEIEVEPDIFYLNFTLNGDSRPIIDQRRDVLDLLKTAKINIDKDLTISRIGTTSRRNSNGTHETIPTQSFRLRLFSTRQLQLISSALERKGIKNQRVDVASSKIEEYEKQVRIQAMQNALEQAQILAGAVGCKAGECLNISDSSIRTLGRSVQNTTMKSVKYDYMEYAEDWEIEASPDLKYEKISLSYTIEAEFALLSGQAK